MKVRKAKQKVQIIKGKVIGPAIQSVSMNCGSSQIFLLELEERVEASFKKADNISLNNGSKIVVKFEGMDYFREGDSLKLRGKFHKVISNEREDSLYFNSDHLFNRTLNLSLGQCFEEEWENSKEDDLKLRGEVLSKPLCTIDINSNYWINFLVKLIEPVQASFKKSEPVLLSSGKVILVSCYKECYVRVGDIIELKGSLVQLSYEKALRSIYFYSRSSEPLYNETLGFYFEI